MYKARLMSTLAVEFETLLHDVFFQMVSDAKQNSSHILRNERFVDSI